MEVVFTEWFASTTSSSSRSSLPCALAFRLNRLNPRKLGQMGRCRRQPRRRTQPMPIGKSYVDVSTELPLELPSDFHSSSPRSFIVPVHKTPMGTFTHFVLAVSIAGFNSTAFFNCDHFTNTDVWYSVILSHLGALVGNNENLPFGHIFIHRKGWWNGNPVQKYTQNSFSAGHARIQHTWNGVVQ